MIWKIKYWWYIALLLNTSVLYAEDATIHLVDYALGDYFYPYVDKSQKNKGCLGQYITKAFAEKGIKVNNAQWLPWNTALKSLNWASEIPRVSFPWSKTKAREKEYIYSKPLYKKPMYIWVNSEQSEAYKNIEDLKDKKICVPQGYGIYGKLKDMVKEKQVIRIMPLTMQDCFNYLKDNKVDAVYAGDDAIENIHKVTNKADIFTKAFIVNEKTHYLVAGKKHPDAQKLIDTFNQGITELKNKGQPLDIQALCFTITQ